MMLENKKGLFIAEIGLNHHGSFKKALRMIELAKEAGADIAKFQYYTPLKVLGADSPYLEYAQRCFFTKDQHESLAFYCRLQGIEYLVSVFDRQDIPWANRLCKRHKVATRMNSNIDFINDLLLTNKPIIMSIQNYAQELPHNNISYMWCVPKYPSSKLEVLVNKFDIRHGLSSHCPDWTASLQAFLEGARVIETHVCEDKTEQGCDIPASLNFEDYKRLIHECSR